MNYGFILFMSHISLLFWYDFLTITIHNHSNNINSKKIWNYYCYMKKIGLCEPDDTTKKSEKKERSKLSAIKNKIKVDSLICLYFIDLN